MEDSSSNEVPMINSDSTTEEIPLASQASTPDKVKDSTICNGFQDTQENHLYLDNLFELTEENKKLKMQVAHLEKENLRLDTESSKELHSIQLEGLEKTINQQRSEMERLQEALRQQAEIFQKQLQQMKAETDAKAERLTKQCEQASKERESMVMKYAVSENSAINLQRQIKQLENKLKEQKKEKESVESKIGVVVAEKAKLSQIIDGKNTEIQSLEREVQKKKDELHGQSSNLKFFQNKLKLELESHKETQIKLEKLNQKLREAKEETEQVRKDGQAILMRYETEGRKVLEIQDSEELTSLQTEMEVARKKNKDLTDENNQLCTKVQNLEKERLEYEENLSQLRRTLDYQKQVGVDLQAAKTEVESLQILLQREREKLQASQIEVERIRVQNSDLVQEMEKCREREAELLAFTQMLTEKNVSIQSELTAVETRAQQQDIDLALAKRQVGSLTAECATLKEELAEEKKQRLEEKELLTRHLEERTKSSEKLSKEVEDQAGEIQLLKKKHVATIKELTRELQACRRRGETLETVSLGQGSRASSNTSLNTMETATTTIPVPPPPTEPDKQLLIEKIVKVQRSNARKQEKLEFLEEHSRQLTIELQRKSRIIQSLIMKQQPGALVSESMDENKIAATKHGGIMASVYSSKASDDAMTLELSLEINRKLQAVLEDTLLKNITLKDNMETLGNEIARLAKQQQISSMS